MSRLPKVLIKILIAPAVLIGIVLTLAFVMVLWSDPEFTAPPDVSPEKLAASGIRFDQPYPAAKRSFRMRDGTRLAAQYFPARSRTTIVLVHGVLSSSYPLNGTSGLLREATGAEVVAIDLRGHGLSGGTPGDTDYIGQYEDDLGDLIQEIRAAGGRRVILAGHSMGGGIALRYAMRPKAPVDGYLLFAPYLGWESPTTRKAPPKAEAEAGAELLKINLPRILGLKLLNTVGITLFNGLRTQFFNLPPELPLRSYSYRAMEGAAPADYRAALAAVKAPLLVIVGSRDEAFDAAAYGGVIGGNSHGMVSVIADATHNGVLRDARAMAAVKRWASSF